MDQWGLTNSGPSKVTVPAWKGVSVCVLLSSVIDELFQLCGRHTWVVVVELGFNLILNDIVDRLRSTRVSPSDFPLSWISRPGADYCR